MPDKKEKRRKINPPKPPSKPVMLEEVQGMTPMFDIAAVAAPEAAPFIAVKSVGGLQIGSPEARAARARDKRESTLNALKLELSQKEREVENLKKRIADLEGMRA